MADSLLIRPLKGPLVGSIRPPGSKSLTNRALVVAALARGRSRLSGVLESDDTRVMVESLRRLGVGLEWDRSTCRTEIDGSGGRFPAESAELDLANSGTSIRFLTAACAASSGRFRLDGNARMRERPIEDLIVALRELGGEARCETETGCPPVVVAGEGFRGGTARVAGSISSQYLSALLMAAPLAVEAVSLEVVGELVSVPYVDMTLGVMEAFGVSVDRRESGFRIAPQPYQAADYAIEPDASAASYFFAGAAISGGRVRVEGLTRSALQGDVEFVDALARMGCRVEEDGDSLTVTGAERLRGIDIDMNAISDTAQTLAAVAVFADGPTTIRRIAHVRHKETDRIGAVATELRRLGQEVEEFEDGLTISPRPVQSAEIQTYDDHRMAMSFALVGLRAAGIRIADPGCTAKTYPGFWEDLERLRGDQ